MKPHSTTAKLSLIGLSLATSPFIVAILVLHFLGEWLEGMGKMSEEVFRADQLPLLHFSEKKSF